MADDDGQVSGLGRTLPSRRPQDELEPDTLIGGEWIIERCVNRGGFATIYRARHGDGDRPAAIKLLHSSLADSPRILTRFEREAETIAELSHPDIVKVYGAGALDDGRPYIVMEWLDGEDLWQELDRRGVFSLAEVLDVLGPLCAALEAAHARGVVHRDLKAQNVMRVAGGIKLVDFGVAKLIAREGDGQGLTRTDEVVGTPYNMAPEQILNGPVDARTDVYALGLLVYWLLTGNNAFTGESASELQDQHLSAPPPRASDRAPVSAAVDAVLARALEKRPGARHPGAQAFRDDLARAASAAPEEGSVPAVAVFLEARVDEDTPDELLDAVEGLVERARARAVEAGMAIVADSGTSFLGVKEAPSPDDRRAAVALGRALAADGPEGCAVRLVLHAAPARRGPGGWLDGPLLHAAQWTAGAPAGLCATTALLAGLDDIEREPVGEQLARVR